MKVNLLTIALLAFVGTTWAQVQVDLNDKRNKKITVEVDKEVDSVEIIVPRGKYHFKIEGGNSFTMKKGAKLYKPLSTESIQGIIKKKGIKSTTKIIFGSNTEYTIVATTDEAQPKERKYVLRSQSDWSWTTTLGANAVVFRNRSKFISQEKDGAHTVAEVQDNKAIELMPSIMFTLMNNHNNVSFGYTGGLGFNFEELAVFTGLSLAIGQNIILTGGVAVHKQNRPNNDYSIGQIIESSVTAENLNQQQYCFNPFIGLSFRFDKNPFKSND